MKFKILLITLISLSCNDKPKEKAPLAEKKETVDLKSDNSDLEVYDFNGFKKFLEKKDGKTYVINFWATWCAPCVKELPYFEKLNKEYNNKNVQVILVSLDFPHLYDKKLKPFIKERKLSSKVIALNDVDMNTWIPQVDENWSGSIPATIIYKNDQRKFYERSFNYEELETELKRIK